ncbi:hypothetical protein V5T82_12405 [Magnetovibrio sp. PR-2]|uniref:hypothetical protein n=1 Tax=Magnetovibrio sp. PR-2 TaxID=3120356 RepID=UPI002FCE5B45
MMIGLRNKVSRFVKVGLGVVICAGALSACQTTSQPLEKKDVTLDDIHIVLPDSLLNLKGFEIERIFVQEEGSYVNEEVKFKGGFFSFERYFRGGFTRVSEHNLDKIVGKYYSSFEPLKPSAAVHANVGTLYHTTIYNGKEDVTCVVGMGNQGRTIALTRGPGYTGRISGQHCEIGKKPDLDTVVLPLLKKIKLRS